MSANPCSCSCGCSPCACSSSGFGCVGDMCVPRPCFFQGQLVTADDLNATVTYFRTREAMLARFVGGWGVLGGLRIDKAPGIQSASLSADIPAAVSPNPQLLAGTTVQVSPGVAIDAGGRALTLCSPQILDIAQLMAEAPTAPTNKSCADWFTPLQNIAGCSALAPTMITATGYWLIAEYVENPSRPVPQFSGGGACDPAPTCDFSRRIEGVRFRLVSSLPPSYFLTGCLDDLALPPEVIAQLPQPEPSTTMVHDSSSNNSVSTNGNDSAACIAKTYTFFEAFNQAAASSCCAHPAVVLGRVIVTSDPGSLRQSLPAGLPLYTFVLDAYPFRRVALSAALSTYTGAQTLCTLEDLGNAIRQLQNPPA